MKTTDTILDRIMGDVRGEVAAAQRERPMVELKRRIADAPPVRSVRAALAEGFGLIGEIKERSPSQGAMRPENVLKATAAYEQSPAVRAFSVLTNATHFGMSMDRLGAVRAQVTKPVLRKDFIYDEYQVYEARAFGADAILLMANLLSAKELAQLFPVARELGLEVLFECHDREQIDQLPAGAEIVGINSRTFATGAETYTAARTGRAAGGQRDLTTDLRRFELGKYLPAHVLKVAESGVHPENIAAIRDYQVYHAVLVGSSLLTAPQGIRSELERFERALALS